MSEINVTPFVDVMLVLLIIFMVAAPLATVDVNVDLPVSNAPASGRPDTPLWLTVGADGGLSLGNDPVTRELLPAALQAATAAGTLAEKDVDGVLVGGASLKAEEFANIARFEKHVVA